MKIERTVELPNQKDIDVSLKLGDEALSFTLRPRTKVDEDALREISEKLREEDKAPKRYAELIELISVSKGLVESYEKRISKELEKEKPSRRKIEEWEEKRARELETLKPLIVEKDTIADKPYNPEPFYEEQARLYCVKGFEALEKYAEVFSWRETVYLIGSLLQEAEGKK